MTDLLEAPVLPPEPPRPRRNPALTALTVLAVLAVAALGIVAVVAINNRDSSSQLRRMNDTHNSMMSGGMNSMMAGGMMNGAGSMMNGSMMGQGASSPTIPGAREIAVTASSFSFVPNEIHVRTGEDVTIVLATADTMHDFTIDELGFHVVARPGQPGRGSFHAPSSAARYTAYCNVAGHRAAGMTATVVVDAG